MTFGTHWVVVVQTSLFVQRLPDVFQSSMAFGTRWVVLVQTSLVHWGDFGSACLESLIPLGTQRSVNVECTLIAFWDLCAAKLKKKSFSFILYIFSTVIFLKFLFYSTTSTPKAHLGLRSNSKYNEAG